MKYPLGQPMYDSNYDAGHKKVPYESHRYSVHVACAHKKFALSNQFSLKFYDSGTDLADPLFLDQSNDLDSSGTYLTLIPGFEGRYQIFNSVTERLKKQAVAVQLASDLKGNSIPEMAATVRKFMKTKFETKSEFFLLGYSFGVNIALELAALLEKEGHVGVVYCLDSSPDALRIQLYSFIGHLNDTQFQNAVLEHIYRLMTGNVSEELKQELESTEGWSKKVNISMKRMKSLVNYSKQYKKSIMETAYNRILMAKEYKPSFKLESEIVLMRGIPHSSQDSLTENYNLSKYIKQPVKVFYFES